MAFGLKQTILFTIFCVVVSNVLAVPAGPPSDVPRPFDCPVGLREIQEDGSVKCRVVPPLHTDPRLLNEVTGLLTSVLQSLLGGGSGGSLTSILGSLPTGQVLNILPVDSILSALPVNSLLSGLPVSSLLGGLPLVG